MPYPEALNRYPAQMLLGWIHSMAEINYPPLMQDIHEYLGLIHELQPIDVVEIVTLILMTLAFHLPIGYRDGINCGIGRQLV
jgi:hypothetical protein